MSKTSLAEQQKLYGFKDMLDGVHTIQASPAHQKRRDIANSVRNIASHLIRMEASDAELSQYAKAFADLEQKLSLHDKVNMGELFKKMINVEASADDILMAHDYNILDGKSTVVGFPLETWIEGDRVKGWAKAPLPFQGPPQRVHGGMVAAIFDVLLAQTQAIAKVMGFTASLEITYHAATPLDTEVQLEAWVEKVDGRKLYNYGEIRVDGKLCASAKGLWISPKTGMLGMNG